MDLGLKDKVVMITGGSRGIGRAISFAFAAEGARLALCSRDPGPLGEVVEKIRSHWRSDVYAAEADMRRPEEVEQFVRGALVHFGRVDVLVNNVGAGLLRGFEELTEEDHLLGLRDPNRLDQPAATPRGRDQADLVLSKAEAGLG